MKIARVFTTKTSMCPTDQDCYFDVPDMFTPKYDKVYISTTFTWDIPKSLKLFNAWLDYGDCVKTGGVAIDGESDKPFESGLFLKKGITITSRGCVNHCPFCMVNKKLTEFDDFPEGNIIQDNNVLACSDKHWRLVIDMLKKQKAIEFKGGLDKYLLTDNKIDDLRGLKIKTLWLACDRQQDIRRFKTVMGKLTKAGFNRNNIFCYVLIGDSFGGNEGRLREVYNAGAMPFAQLFRDKNNTPRPKMWKQFARKWSRPAIIKSVMKDFK